MQIKHNNELTIIKWKDLKGCSFWIKINSMKDLIKFLFRLGKAIFKKWGHFYFYISNEVNVELYINGRRFK